VSAPGWPAVLREGCVLLRPLRRRDTAPLMTLRQLNQEWLSPWEAVVPRGAEAAPATFKQYADGLKREARRGLALPWVIEYEGMVAGQAMITNIARGAVCSGVAGYWVGRSFAGRGIAPTALALAVDHAIRGAGLHRVEVAIQPENTASLRVVAKLGFREEGVRPRFLHVAGGWADHRIFALTAEDVAPSGLVARWRQTRPSTPAGLAGGEAISASGAEEITDL
jgi:ribosomal-protein-alanine N-acetyltransferase